MMDSLLFACWVLLHAFLSSADFFSSKLTSLKTFFRATIRVSNSLEPEQARHIVGPDLVPNCLQMFLADNKSCCYQGEKLNSAYNILQIKPVLNSH